MRETAERNSLRGNLEEWQRFLVAEAHILRALSRLLYQQAANQPDSTAPARAARARWDVRRETRPWLQHVNKPQTRSACLMTLAGHSGSVKTCAVSPDGRRIVSASSDHTLKLWDALTGAELATLAGHLEGVWACALSSDGRRVVSASEDHTLRVWDAQTGTLLTTLAGQSPFAQFPL